MSGYTPVFDSVFQGTLCGRWPDTGVWLCLLALADRDGRIDSTIPYISAVTGIPAQTLTECIERFTAPDPASRTPSEDGRRLVLIDPERAWGWRVVNHAKYREKARLLSKNQREIESGKNKGRMADRRRPPETASDHLSDSDINSDKRESRATRLPSDFQLTPERRLSAEKEGLAPERTFEKFCDYWRAVPGAKGKKIDWDATWRNWCRNDKDAKPVSGKRHRGVVV